MHDSPGETGSHFPSAPLAANGAVVCGSCVDSRHTQLIALFIDYAEAAKQTYTYTKKR